MTSARTCIGLLLALLVGACADDSSPPGPDSGATVGDSSLDALDSSVADTEPPPPMCGNAIPEARESCDDGNDVAGDGCTSECLLEARCSDGVVGDDEICDDGNRAAGDGCRGDCGSDETCGNGTLDVAAGEVCDDGNTGAGDGCSADCRVAEGCGDGALTAPELCDDANTTRWDGCGPDCREEQVLVISTLQIDPDDVGCDLNHSGGADNMFSTALGRLLGIQNAQIQSSIDGGVLLLTLPLYGLEDPTDDDFFTTSVVAAFDADPDRTNNFDGFGEFLADRRSLGLTLLPNTLFTGRVSGGAFEAGPADIDIVFIIAPDFPALLGVAGARLHGVVTARDGEIARIDDGQLCGVLTMNSLAAYVNPLIGLPGFENVLGCDGQEVTSFADLAVGGASPLGLSTTRVQPDVDVDGDGLERFEALTTGPTGCQAVISACIDGDGTRVEGADCDLDPRFADGFSSSMSFTAVAAEVIGVAR